MAVGEVGVSIEVQDLLKGKPKPDLEVALAILESMTLLVGIPEKKAAREGGGLNNAQLAYIQSQGSPVNGIPPRPFIEPAIEQPKVMASISEEYRQAFVSAAMGDAAGAERCLNLAGMYARNAVIQYMGSDALEPNAPITISGGWMRNKKSGKPFLVKGKGSNNPLINTGSLRSSVEYVIEKGGAK